MKTVKWYLINLHVWIVLFDYSVGLLTVPIVLLPAFAGYPNGLLKYFGVPTLFQGFMVLLFLAYVHISHVAIFENRFHTLCNFHWKKYWAWVRKPWLIFHFLGIFGVLASFGYLVPNQDEAIDMVLKSLPCLPSNIPIFVLTIDHTYHLIIIVFFIISTSSETLTFLTIIIWSTRKKLKRKILSRKTFQMQKIFFCALVIQITIPLITMIIPFIYSWMAVLFDYHNQAYTNFAVITSSMHGLVSTIVMLLVHRPYREELWLMFCGRCQGRSEKIVKLPLKI